jgi:hypothetical protein
MKSYTNLYPSPDKDYVLFNEASSVSPASLDGLGDNHGFKRLEMYMKNEMQQKREINRKSDEINKNNIIYSFDDITRNPYSAIKKNDKEQIVTGEVNYQTIDIPFYMCLIDIVISNNIPIEVVEHNKVKTKGEILIRGKIRKYRGSSSVKIYNIYIEMENEDVFHVNKSGIMMRVRVSEDMRQFIYTAMDNYVTSSGEVNESKSGARGCFSCFNCFKD